MPQQKKSHEHPDLGLSQAILRSSFNFPSHSFLKFSEYNVVSFFVAVADEVWIMNNGVDGQLRLE